MKSIDEEIARHLKEAADSGELSRAASYGKPLEELAGWDDTPAALRLPFKILKDAGVVPPEIEMFRERARLLETIAGCDDASTRATLQSRVDELNLRIALRLESLRKDAAL